MTWDGMGIRPWRRQNPRRRPARACQPRWLSGAPEPRACACVPAFPRTPHTRTPARLHPSLRPTSAFPHARTPAC
eukprot:81464-Chlamydomonas_euryale.AAC.1